MVRDSDNDPAGNNTERISLANYSAKTNHYHHMKFCMRDLPQTVSSLGSTSEDRLFRFCYQIYILRNCSITRKGLEK